LGLAGPSETFFGHRPIFGGRLHENFLGRIYCKIFPTLSALCPTQQRNYEQFSTSALKTTAAGSGGLLSGCGFLDQALQRQAHRVIEIGSGEVGAAELQLSDESPRQTRAAGSGQRASASEEFPL
jgi:hypothetical protein